MGFSACMGLGKRMLFIIIDHFCTLSMSLSLEEDS